jgi:hypothetical protein
MEHPNDRLIGQSWEIPTPKHAGHTLTVERRDIEKHAAYWLVCSCGARTTIGSHWLQESLRTDRRRWSPYQDADDRILV